MGKQTDSRPKLASLELGRFLAATYVLLAHMVPDVNAHAAPGAGQIWHWLGVTGGGAAIEYFFVLSGFVMACSHGQDFGQLSAVPRFWWKRARRIYPMYWLALVIPAIYSHAGLTPGYSTQILTLAPVQTNELLPPAWTLRFEMTFYLMFGLCLLPYIGKPILALWIAATLWHWWPGDEIAFLHLPQQPAWLYWFGAGSGMHFLSFMEFFFFAGLAAGWIFMAWQPDKWLSLAITLTGIVMTVTLRNVMNFGGPHPAIPMIALVAITMAVVMLGFAGLERHGILRLPRAALWAGTLSYPLYILHAALLMLFWRLVPHFMLGSAGVLLLFYGQLAAIFTIASLAAFLLDQRLQRLLRRWDKAKQVPALA
jgi:peptidoglycan/LPS O-acetylase OafA/YrhL